MNTENIKVENEETVAGQTSFELGETNMNQNTELFLLEEEGFLTRNKNAVGAAAGVGVAGFLGGFITGKFTEKRKNKILMNAIAEELSNFNEVIEGKAEGEISEMYAFRNATDIKNKILEKLDDAKMSEKEREEWKGLLSMIISISVIGREEQTRNEKRIITEVTE